MRLVPVLLLLVAALSGCLGGDDAADEAPPEAPADDAPADGPPMDPSRPDNGTAAAPPSEILLHLSADHTLVPAEQAPADPVAVPLEGGPDAFVVLAGQGTWAGASPALPIAITAVTLELSFGHEGGGAANPGFPPIGAFFGSSASSTSFTFIDGPATVAPGEVHRVVSPLPLPAGGLVVPAGAALEVVVVLGYTPHAPAGARNFVQVGSGEAGSRLVLTAEIVALPEAIETLAWEEQGMGDGAECFEPGDPTGTAFHDYALEVSPDTVGVRVELARMGGQGQEDLDLEIVDAAGAQVAGGHTPEGNEQVTLYAPNLAASAPGTWTVRVIICGAQAQATFTVQAWTSAAAAPAAQEPLMS